MLSFAQLQLGALQIALGAQTTRRRSLWSSGGNRSSAGTGRRSVLRAAASARLPRALNRFHIDLPASKSRSSWRAPTERRRAESHDLIPVRCESGAATLTTSRNAPTSPASEPQGACRPLRGLSEIAHLYRGFVIDLWGCVHDGETLFESVPECLERMREGGRQLLFVSNSTQPRGTIAASLREMGVEVPEDEILTSGDVIREQLGRPADDVFLASGGRVFHLARPETGPAGRRHEMVRGSGARLVDRVEEATMVLLSYFGDEDEDHSAVYAALEEACGRGLPVVCTNPDRLSYNGARKRFPAGHYAALYEGMGGRAVYYGKPHPPIYAAAMRRLAGRGVAEAGAVLAIGDSLETDVAGGRTQGMPGLLLACGIHQEELRPTPDLAAFDEAAARPLCQRLAIWPEYLLPVLRW